MQITPKNVRREVLTMEKIGIRDICEGDKEAYFKLQKETLRQECVEKNR